MNWHEEFIDLMKRKAHHRWNTEEYEGVHESIADIYFGRHQGLEAPEDAFQRFLEIDKRIHK